MRQFLIELLLLTAVVLVVMAVFFRDRRARELLRTMRNAAWIYVALVLVLGAVEAVRRLS